MIEKILEPFSRYGEFWLPGKRKRIPGFLTFSPQTGTSIHLQQSFAMAYARGSVSFTAYQYDEVLGCCDDGRYIGLVRCGSSGPRIASASVFVHSETIISPNPLIVYDQCRPRNPQNEQWTSLYLSMPGISEWLTLQPFSIKNNMQQDPPELVLTYSVPDVPKTLSSSNEWTIGTDISLQASTGTGYLSSIEYSPCFFIKPTSQQSIDYFMQFAYKLRCLFMLLSRKRIHYTDFRLVLPTKEMPASGEILGYTVSPSVTLFFRQPFYRQPFSILPYDLLLHYGPNLKWDQVICNFIIGYDAVSHCLGLLESVVYNDSPTPEYRLLALVQALEGLHRADYPASLHCTSDAYKPILKEIRKSLPSMPTQLRWSVANSIAYANEYSLLKRLEALRDLLSPTVAAELCADWDRFLRRIRDFRHDISHQLGKGSTNSEQLYWDSVRCELWLSILLLKRCGLPDEEMLPNLRIREGFQLSRMRATEA